MFEGCLTNTYKETPSLTYLTFPDFSYPNIIPKWNNYLYYLQLIKVKQIFRIYIG